MFRKILLIFLSLSTCFVLNINFAHAAKHPQCKRNDVYDQVHTSDPYKKGLLYVVTEYVPHDALETLAKNANKRQDAEKIAQITLVTGISAAVGGVLGFALGQGPGAAVGVAGGSSIGGGLAGCVTSSIQNEGDKWLEASVRNSYCGVKMHYWINPLNGNWEYGSFDPQ